MDKPLRPCFFERDAEVVASDLIGCHLVRKRGRKVLKHRITETEAYIGPHDLACHASRGRTIRTEPMFGPAGTLYIYLIYGLHWMLNVVTGPVDYPAAVLIRSVDTITGPGRLTRALRITAALNNHVATNQENLWFVEDASRAPARVKRSERIGVSYAGPIWSKKPLRFLLEPMEHSQMRPPRPQANETLPKPVGRTL